MLPRLIATDLDGTLLRSDRTFSPRTRAAFEAALDAGVAIVAASGRQLFSMRNVLAGTPFERVAIGSNGAAIGDLATGEILHEEPLSVAAQTALHAAMVARFPGVRCASVRDGGSSFFPQRGYVGYMNPRDHDRDGDLPEYDLADVLAAPSVKLVLRDPDVDPEALLAAARAAAVPGCEVVLSGVPFLEVSAAGVTKASGLAWLCARLGVRADEVLAFGDHANDAPMLAWAGWGVAMADAHPEALAAADAVTSGNDDDGVALVVESVL